jgi:hypothetical protein
VEKLLESLKTNSTNAMNELLGKISSYNLFNYLFTGVVFVILSKQFTPYSFIQSDIVIGIFLYYFIGLVISRLGSLLLEPLLKKSGFVKFAKYSDFVLVSKNDSQLEILSEVNNMYRTLTAVFIALGLLKAYALLQSKFAGLSNGGLYILFAIFLIMFLFAYRKQTAYITNRISINAKNHE